MYKREVKSLANFKGNFTQLEHFRKLRGSRRRYTSAAASINRVAKSLARTVDFSIYSSLHTVGARANGAHL